MGLGGGHVDEACRPDVWQETHGADRVTDLRDLHQCGGFGSGVFAVSDLSANNKSGFRGVSWYRRDQKWVAQITFNRRVIRLGCFADIKQAARAYNKAALRYRGEEARLNYL
jgi:AP2 domain